MLGGQGNGPWGGLEAQKAKYHVLSQLQPLAVSLASGDPLQGQVRTEGPLGETMSHKPLWLPLARVRVRVPGVLRAATLVLLPSQP
jgi:hypothetical protein